MAKFSLFNSREDGCFICGNPYVEEHHIYYGVGRRKISDREGCVVYLCHRHHQGNEGVHFNHEFDMALKQKCQEKWEELHNGDREAFRKTFYASYL